MTYPLKIHVELLQLDYLGFAVYKLSLKRLKDGFYRKYLKNL